ncbi:probable serine/threonine-protein kinase roco5 [Saccostrea cucullata]|uniref:probable serine/threonine-protein kinase roco5 n=1 Tax=Saccostrea cuccullata TaxID=36930 RepID=UPI002ED3EBD2
MSALQTMEQSDENKSMNNPIPNTTLGRNKNETDDLQLTQAEMREMLDAQENETSVSMFDFAGQFAYYACHQIYIRSEAFYILVMDMSKAFKDVVNSESEARPGSIFSKWTYKDYLDFWLDSIKSFSGPSAQVLVVATHTEGKTKELFYRNCVTDS